MQPADELHGRLSAQDRQLLLSIIEANIASALADGPADGKHRVRRLQELLACLGLAASRRALRNARGGEPRASKRLVRPADVGWPCL